MLNLLVILIFIRPFISSLAFPYADLICSLSLLLALICRILLKGLPLEEIKSLKYPFIVFICAIIFSALLSHDKSINFKELQKYAINILVFLASASLADKERTKIVRAIVMAGFIIGLLAIYQYFFGFWHLLGYISEQGINNQFTLDYIRQSRVFFPFVTPNILAGYLIMIIPLSFMYKDSFWLLMALGFSLFLTQSLGAFLSLLLGIILCFYLQGGSRKKAVFVFSGLLATAGIIFIIRSQAPGQHLQPVFSTARRLAYWRETIAIIRSHPFIGIGPGNLDLAHSRYAHNSYLQLWAETGILGLVAFIWMIISIFRANIQSIMNSSYNSQIVLLLTSCAAFIIHNLIDLTFFLPEVSFIFWLFFGLLVTFR